MENNTQPQATHGTSSVGSPTAGDLFPPSLPPRTPSTSGRLMLLLQRLLPGLHMGLHTGLHCLDLNHLPVMSGPRPVHSEVHMALANEFSTSMVK
eukprot:scaffold24453_cov79-Skeletonema_marinoi.AAC.1